MSTYRLLCGHDCSEPAADAPGCALGLATRARADLYVRYADERHRRPFDKPGPPDAPPARLRANGSNRLQDVPPHDHALPRTPHLARRGEPAKGALASFAAGSDTDRVMATHGRGGLPRGPHPAFGSTVERRLPDPPCPSGVAKARAHHQFVAGVATNAVVPT